MKLERKENEVAEILVKLASLICELESQSGILLPQRWGRKRKRSAVAVTPKPDSVSFSRRHHHNHNNSKRERYLKIIQGLTNDNHLLNREMKNVKCYFEKLKEYNLKLKARKQALCQKKQWQWQWQWQFHPPFIHGNQFARGQATTSLRRPSFSGGGLGLGLGLGLDTNSDNDGGPIGIPDLNLPLQEPIAPMSGLMPMPTNSKIHSQLPLIRIDPRNDSQLQLTGIDSRN